ncbi:MAG TPA: Uma2 family endonuclease, partial [Saprospiraceae bacterium]|nr:Uma2 family endonuclease [Saprospiraceae bacterium]
KKVEEPDMAGYYTYADYLTWEFEGYVELIRGKIYKMSPAPNTYHQRVVGSLYLPIAQFLKKHPCEVFLSPFDVRLPLPPHKIKNEQIDTVVQPDLCVVCDPAKIDQRGCLGAPGWIVEILSGSTSRKDLREKFDIYQNAGVKEYWVVHPTDHTLTVFLLNAAGKYESLQTQPFVKGDKVPVRTLPGLEIDLEEIFENCD